MVSGRGFEPPISHERWILSPLHIPILPPRDRVLIIVLSNISIHRVFGVYWMFLKALPSPRLLVYRLRGQLSLAITYNNMAAEPGVAPGLPDLESGGLLLLHSALS